VKRTSFAKIFELEQMYQITIRVSSNRPGFGSHAICFVFVSQGQINYCRSNVVYPLLP